MYVAQTRSALLSVLITLLLASFSTAQSLSPTSPTKNASSANTTTSSLAPLPEADTIIYLSPQRIINQAAPRLISPTDLLKLRATLADLKRAIGLDPGNIDSFAIALRFGKPSGDLGFVAPEVVTVFSGDFSSDSLITLANLYLGENARSETYGSKALTVTRLDSFGDIMKSSSLLKDFSELGIAPLNANTVAIGSVAYVKAALDASEGIGPQNQTLLNGLAQNPSTLISISGSPLKAFAKTFGLFGTQTEPREGTCNTNFGDFYAAVTMDASKFSIQGTMKTDNPNTATILNGLLSGVLSEGSTWVTDKDAQTALQRIKLESKEDEIVFSADISNQTVSSFLKGIMDQKPATPAKPVRKTRRRTRRK